MGTVPYLSYCIISRNDEFAFKTLKMFQASVDGIIEQLDRNGLDSELILVEWNPIEGVRRLAPEIRWPRSSHCSIRVIEVPHEFHARFAYNEKKAMHCACAMNCAIRRARGQFILPSASDHLFSEPLVAFIAEKKLEGDVLYRIDLTDVSKEVIEEDSLEKRLAYCRSHVIGIRSAGVPDRPGWPKLHTDACGDFQLMARENWKKLHGYREAEIPSWHVDTLVSYSAFAAGMREILLKPPLSLFHIEHEKRSVRQQWERREPLLKAIVDHPMIPQRLRERILGSGLYSKIHAVTAITLVNGISVGTSAKWVKLAEDIWRKRIDFALNGEGWGLGEVSLPEKVVHRALWDSRGEKRPGDGIHVHNAESSVPATAGLTGAPANVSSEGIEHDRMSKTPYLSYAITTRNDDFGIKNIKMLEVSITSLIEQLDRNGLDSELILLEWNPIEGVRRLADEIRWPRSSHCSIRTIEVPHEFHAPFAYSDKMPMHGACAMNCAIRRARGEFILPGASDHLFSEPLVAFMAEKQLDKDVLYRIGLTKVDRGVIEKETSREQLEYCSSHVTTVTGDRKPYRPGWPPLFVGCTGDFQLMSRGCWKKLRGYREEHVVSFGCDDLLSYAAYAAGVKETVLDLPFRLYHIEHEKREKRQGWYAKKMWLEKAVELPFIPQRVRSRIIGSGVYATIVYNSAERWVNGIPLGKARAWLSRMEEALWKKKIHYAFNGESWGLGGVELPERFISRAKWDRQEEPAL